MIANKLAAQMRNVNLQHFAQVELRDALVIMKTNALCIRNVTGIPATQGIRHIRRLQRRSRASANASTEKRITYVEVPKPVDIQDHVVLTSATAITMSTTITATTKTGVGVSATSESIARQNRAVEKNNQIRGRRIRLASVHQDGAPMAAQHLTTPKIAMVTECPTHNVKACQPRVSLDISHPPKIAMTNGGEVTMSKTVCRLKHCWNHNQKSISIAGGLA